MAQTLKFEGVEILSNGKPKNKGDRPPVFRNFSGKPVGDYNSTTRFFTIKVPTEMVPLLQDMHIDMWNPKNTNEDGSIAYNVRVDISESKSDADKLNVKAYMVGENGVPIELNKNTIGIVDDPSFLVEKIDCFCGVTEKQKTPGHYKLWANVLYIYQNTRSDPFAYKFAKNEEASYED